MRLGIILARLNVYNKHIWVSGKRRLIQSFIKEALTESILDSSEHAR